MTETIRGQRGDQSATKRESLYRGRKIEVYTPSTSARDAGAPARLHIDGKEIEIEQTEQGVMSHENMFKVYASPFELAEDLIRQWGDAEIRPAEKPDGHTHPH